VTSTPPPALIVVSGPPGAGKTTLAHAIARGVGCPALCRDEIREGITHAGTPDPDMRRTNDTFFGALEFLLRAGVSVVAEAAFQDRLWRPGLVPLAGLAAIRVVRCALDPAIALDRIAHRLAEQPTRAAHGDQAQLNNPGRLAAWVPIDLPLPTLIVDTSAGYSPGLAEIVSFATG